MKFNPGFSIEVSSNPMNFLYGDGVQGPQPELRRLDQIRSSLLNPDCTGPEEVYCIAMDVAEKQDHPALVEQNLLYGVVTYAKGLLGKEPVRSQGHIHAVSPSCGASTCEVYEIWEGAACIYMQESGADNAGRCYAVMGKPGDVIIVPPGWVHATINSDPAQNMTFGAWCVRDYGFDYAQVRRHGGIAFFPVMDQGIVWERNPSYTSAALVVKNARTYADFGLQPGKPIYQQYQENHHLFDFVTHPLDFPQLWENYQP